MKRRMQTQLESWEIKKATGIPMAL